VTSSYDTNTKGTLTVGTGSVTYASTAKLLSMRSVNIYGGGSGVVQTWEITGVGTIPGTVPATVEVKGVLERAVVDAQTFAVFATGNGCGAITMDGNVDTGSYDSQNVGAGTSNSTGNLGTNGNLSYGGSVNVYGSLSSPRVGVGACTNGNVTASSPSGSVSPPSGGSIQLPQPITFPPPPAPSPMPPTGNMSGATICSAISLPALCTNSGGVVTIDPMGQTIRLGNISGNVVLKGGNYVINSIGAGDLTVGTSLSGAAGVTINIGGKTAGNTDLNTVIDLGGNNVANASMNPANLQILYAGPSIINMRGGSEAAFMLYAPNANVHTYGNADIYGSVLTNTLRTHGNTRFFYDRRMSQTFKTLGNWVMSSFSWRKY
jgi:hypothetical protein